MFQEVEAVSNVEVDLAPAEVCITAPVPEVRSKPTLLNLPSEIRLKIWRYVRTPYRINTMVDNHNWVGGRYEHPVFHVKNFNAGALRVCQQMHRELTEINPVSVMSTRGLSGRNYWSWTPDSVAQDERLLKKFNQIMIHPQAKLDYEARYRLRNSHLEHIILLVIEADVFEALTDFEVNVRRMSKLERIEIINDGIELPNFDPATCPVDRKYDRLQSWRPVMYGEELLMRSRDGNGFQFVQDMRWLDNMKEFIRQNQPTCAIQARQLLYFYRREYSFELVNEWVVWEDWIVDMVLVCSTPLIDSRYHKWKLTGKLGNCV